MSSEAFSCRVECVRIISRYEFSISVGTWLSWSRHVCSHRVLYKKGGLMGWNPLCRNIWRSCDRASC